MTSEFTIPALLQAYRDGSATPAQVILDAAARAAAADPAIWISRPSELQLRAYLAALDGESPATRPLYGIPFAIKDNIDCAGLPTTAACPAWSYEPSENAFVVDLLIKAGAIPMGKTNLDQFATGLVGVRSPYGVPKNAFHDDYIPGGSSSGSAVAVARGLCSFALGTDTAGSGRVPAAFNNLVGLKPTRGLLSCRGVVPACRTLDCVSIFALTVADAAAVLAVTARFDEADAYARPQPALPAARAPLRIGVPRRAQLDFFGNSDAEALFQKAVEQVATLGWKTVETDISSFLDAARLLYEGPWVAERAAVIEQLLAENPGALLPVTRQIIAGGLPATAVDAFKAQYRLAGLKRASAAVWQTIDALLMPTAGTIYTLAEVAAEPIKLNSNLGRYTNFMNLLDLCGCAVPAGFLGAGLPWGVTFYAPAGGDDHVLDCAAAFHARSDGCPPSRAFPEFGRRLAAVAPCAPTLQIAVCGAHMEGLALHWQLSDRQARLVQKTKSAPCYRLYQLPGHGTTPDRPGMVRVSNGGAAIDLEVWEIPQSTVGSFLAGIAAPLGLGKVELADGTRVCGFVCEAIAAESSQDITHYGGWHQWLSGVASA